MERMAEFVKQRARVVEAQKRRLAVRGLGEVAYIDDQRTAVAGEPLLVAQSRHPRAAAFGGAGKIVAEEQSDLAVVASAHLPDAHVRVPGRNIGALGKAQAEQTFCCVEHRFDYAIEIEIRFDLRLIDIAALLPQFLCVITPVPRREREVAAL